MHGETVKFTVLFIVGFDKTSVINRALVAAHPRCCGAATKTCATTLTAQKIS